MDLIEVVNVLLNGVQGRLEIGNATGVGKQFLDVVARCVSHKHDLPGSDNIPQNIEIIGDPRTAETGRLSDRLNSDMPDRHPVAVAVHYGDGLQIIKTQSGTPGY